MAAVTDRASYRNRGGIRQRLTSAYLAWRYVTRCGRGVVIKHNAEFWLTDNAVLEVGNDCTIQNYAFFQLTKPNPRVIIGDNTVIGANAVVTHDIPANAIAGGVPARIIRYRE